MLTVHDKRGSNVPRDSVVARYKIQPSSKQQQRKIFTISFSQQRTVAMELPAVITETEENDRNPSQSGISVPGVGTRC